MSRPKSSDAHTRLTSVPLPSLPRDTTDELRLRRGGLRSVHLRDVLVVHGSEEALEYESGTYHHVTRHLGLGCSRSSRSLWLPWAKFCHSKRPYESDRTDG